MKIKIRKEKKIKQIRIKNPPARKVIDTCDFCGKKGVVFFIDWVTNKAYCTGLCGMQAVTLASDEARKEGKKRRKLRKQARKIGFHLKPVKAWSPGAKSEHWCSNIHMTEEQITDTLRNAVRDP